MKLLKRLLTYALIILSLSINAAEYKMALPYGPGSQSDSINRAIVQKFTEITGDTIIIENKPSTNGAIAINYFKANKDVQLLALGSGIVVSDPSLKEAMYVDGDFDNLFYIGTSPFFLLASNKSGIKSLDEFISNMPEFIGSNSDTGKINSIVFAKEKNKSITYVPYKDSPAVILAVMTGELPIGNIAATKNLLELHRTGKLTILGTSYKEDIVVGDITIPSIPKKLKIPQFNGFMSLAIKSDLDPKLKQKLKDGLWRAIRDPEVREKAKQAFVLPDESDDMIWFNKFIQITRNNMKRQANP